MEEEEGLRAGEGFVCDDEEEEERVGIRDEEGVDTAAGSVGVEAVVAGGSGEAAVGGGEEVGVVEVEGEIGVMVEEELGEDGRTVGDAGVENGWRRR